MGAERERVEGTSPAEVVTSFVKDRSGTLLLIGALALPVLLMAAGLAIDVSRNTSFKTRLQRSADAAALAAAVASRNGLDSATVETLAAEVFSSNFRAGGGTASSPNIALSNNGTTFTATVSASGTMPTTFSRAFNFESTSAAATSTAESDLGPSVAINAGKLTGKGELYGDPVFNLNGGTNYYVDCMSQQWYNALSDGGVEWNTRCADHSNTVDTMIYVQNKIFVGSHVITFDAVPQTSANYWDDCYGTDDIVNDPNTGWKMTCAGWPARITVDGQTYDPRPDLTGGTSSRQLVNDSAAGITVSVQATANKIPASFGTVPQDNYNFLAVVITTPHYNLYITHSGGMVYSEIVATNAGMCGSPDGVWGRLLAGNPSENEADFRIANADIKMPQFNWSPICTGGASKYTRLVK